MVTAEVSQSDAGCNLRERHLKERLELVIDGLRGTTLFNPAGVAAAACGMWMGEGALGRLPLRNMLMAVAIQIVMAGLAWAMRRQYPDLEGVDLKRVQWQLTALQAAIGLGWAAAALLFWNDGHDANNVFVAMLVICIAWAMAFLRSHCQRVFFTGLAALGIPVEILFARAPGHVAFMLFVMLPLWGVYIVLMGLGARQRVAALFDAQFANQTMSEALKNAHEVAIRKRHEAEAANVAKTVFLANMSHELRTPLNAILGFSDIIAEQSLGPGNPRYQEYAKDIHASGAHLLSLINDILDVAKIEAGRMELDPRPLDPAEAFSDVERIMAVRAREKGQSLIFAVAEGTPWPVVDHRAFKQIVLNLLSNAVKFTQIGGTIRVHIRPADRSGALLTVEDNGPGISQDKLETVFQAFSQVDNRYDRNQGGTGLGLALVQGLAQMHDGKAWIESEHGHGAHCYVYFPLAISAPDEAERAAT